MTAATGNGTGLAEATRRIAALEQARNDENRRHEAEEARLDREIAEARHRRDLVLAGATMEVVELAEQVIEVYRPENIGRGDGRAVTAQAIRDLAEGAPKLQMEYLGTKNYDRWEGQAEGGFYGSGPRHGTTVFAIRLQPPYRKRWNRGAWEDGKPLAESQIDAAIAYLHALLGTLVRP